jgi:tetratricopeptide (TPR) repeat protein
MKKQVGLIGLIIVCIAALGFIWKFRESATVNTVFSPPEILDIQKSQAVVAWTTDNAVQGRVSYRSAGGNFEPSIAIENVTRSYRHEVIITNLNPASRYTYWIEGSNDRFQFQTQPETSTPFSFLAVYGPKPEQISQWVMTEFPDYILDLTPVKASGNAVFDAVRPYLPIYNRYGVDSPYLSHQRDSKSKEQVPPEDWVLDWGGLRLIMLNAASDIRGFTESFQGHTLGIWLGPGLIDFQRQAFSADALRETDFHAASLDHNRSHPKKPVHFTMFAGNDRRDVFLDGIQYLSLPANDPSEAGALRLDIDVALSVAVDLRDRKEISLKKAVLKEKITCAECRRLADRGTYEAALAAYQTFIRNNQGHFQIDDAYFAIAEIYDEKLFNLRKAESWYRQLSENYPLSPLTPLALQRLKFIKAYADYDYAPLEKFERIKKLEFARKSKNSTDRSRILNKVAALIERYPDSALAPAMQNWLAAQLRQENPAKAVSAYLTLKKTYERSLEAREATLNIADIFYQNGHYRKARDAYRLALTDLPQRQGAISEQVNRCSRNIRRVWLAWIAGGLLAGSFFIVLRLQSFRPNVKTIYRGILVLAVLVPVNLLAAWAIHEQFTSYGEMIWLTGALSLAAVLAGCFSALLLHASSDDIPASVKSSLHSGRLAAAIGLGVLVQIAASYLALFFVNDHYLIIINL